MRLNSGAGGAGNSQGFGIGSHEPHHATPVGGQSYAVSETGRGVSRENVDRERSGQNTSENQPAKQSVDGAPRGTRAGGAAATGAGAQSGDRVPPAPCGSDNAPGSPDSNSSDAVFDKISARTRRKTTAKAAGVAAPEGEAESARKAGITGRGGGGLVEDGDRTRPSTGGGRDAGGAARVSLSSSTGTAATGGDDDGGGGAGYASADTAHSTAEQAEDAAAVEDRQGSGLDGAPIATVPAAAGSTNAAIDSPGRELGSEVGGDGGNGSALLPAGAPRIRAGAPRGAVRTEAYTDRGASPAADTDPAVSPAHAATGGTSFSAGASDASTWGGAGSSTAAAESGLVLLRGDSDKYRSARKKGQGQQQQQQQRGQ